MAAAGGVLLTSRRGRRLAHHWRDVTGSRPYALPPTPSVFLNSSFAVVHRDFACTAAPCSCRGAHCTLSCDGGCCAGENVPQRGTGDVTQGYVEVVFDNSDARLSVRVQLR